MAGELDYLAHLRRESARFAQAVSEAPPGAPVPSCPGWNAEDLLWHLAEVQWFWGTVVRDRLDGEQADARRPLRPGDRAGLAAFFLRVSQDLAEILSATAPGTPAWTWSQDQTAGFIRRRQAHEALIHRVDAELTAGTRTPMDPRLSADGVDEALRVMHGAVPRWGTFSPDTAGTLRLIAADTGDSWLVTLGRFTGTDPDDQAPHDELIIRTAGTDPGGPAAATASGTAADLDCWLWGRPNLAPVTQAGDREVLGRFGAIIGAGIA
jgi:uncharacterized protein (TIGR03083 family)